jgi:anti-sigma regulatory factor (Ser/Thr protein kinase)
MTATLKLLAYQFPACAEQMGCVRQKLRDALGKCGESEAVVNNVVLAVGEACMNIIQHAYGATDKGDIVLEVELETNGSKEAGRNAKRSLVFRLTDFAKHKSCAEQMRSRPLDEIRPGGLGCHIINQVMDEVHLLDRPGPCGNVLQMRKILSNSKSVGLGGDSPL